VIPSVHQNKKRVNGFWVFFLKYFFQTFARAACPQRHGQLAHNAVGQLAHNAVGQPGQLG
jgi:hypothetical protein